MIKMIKDIKNIKNRIENILEKRNKNIQNYTQNIKDLFLINNYKHKYGGKKDKICDHLYLEDSFIDFYLEKNIIDNLEYPNYPEKIKEKRKEYKLKEQQYDTEYDNIHEKKRKIILKRKETKERLKQLRLEDDMIWCCKERCKPNNNYPNINIPSLPFDEYKEIKELLQKIEDMIVPYYNNKLYILTKCENLNENDNPCTWTCSICGMEYSMDIVECKVCGIKMEV